MKIESHIVFHLRFLLFFFSPTLICFDNPCLHIFNPLSVVKSLRPYSLTNKQPCKPFFQVCVEWDPSPNPKHSKGEALISSAHPHEEASKVEDKTPTPTTRGASRRGDEEDDEEEEYPKRKPKKKPIRKTHAMLR